MFHQIKFHLRGIAELESPGRTSLEQLVIKPRTQLKAQIRPYVIESSRGPVEVADLSLEDGSVARAVRFATFGFVEE